MIINPVWPENLESDTVFARQEELYDYLKAVKGWLFIVLGVLGVAEAAGTATLAATIKDTLKGDFDNLADLEKKSEKTTVTFGR